jgi:hypothetical protein
MNQHQFPPCFDAILFIRLNVPPRKVEVFEKMSFWRLVSRFSSNGQI